MFRSSSRLGTLKYPPLALPKWVPSLEWSGWNPDLFFHLLHGTFSYLPRKIFLPSDATAIRSDWGRSIFIMFSSRPLLPCRSASETILCYFLRWSNARWMQWEGLWRYSSACVWFGLSLVFALFVPDIGLVIGLLGGIAVLFILVFPGRFSVVSYLFRYLFTYLPEYSIVSMNGVYLGFGTVILRRLVVVLLFIYVPP